VAVEAESMEEAVEKARNTRLADADVTWEWSGERMDRMARCDDWNLVEDDENEF
jgi:hypothetical protein